MMMRTRLIGLLLFAIGNLQAQAAEPPTLRFEDVFQTDPGAAPLHYQADYTAGGVRHGLEVWADHGTRLKRVTDGALEVHAERKTGDDDYQMTVLDLQRHIATRVDRGNLYRMGHFSDWFELAQGLRHPRGDYRLARASAPANAPAPLQACDWYALTQDGQSTAICWSGTNHVPLLIVSAQGATLWRVTHLDRQAIAARQFEVHDQGFVRNDANGDIEGD